MMHKRSTHKHLFPVCVTERYCFVAKRDVPSVTGGTILCVSSQTDTMSQRHVSTFCSCSGKIIALSATVKMMNAPESYEN